MVLFGRGRGVGAADLLAGGAARGLVAGVAGDTQSRLRREHPRDGLRLRPGARHRRGLRTGAGASRARRRPRADAARRQCDRGSQAIPAAQLAGRRPGRVVADAGGHGVAVPAIAREGGADRSRVPDGEHSDRQRRRVAVRLSRTSGSGAGVAVQGAAARASPASSRWRTRGWFRYKAAALAWAACACPACTGPRSDGRFDSDWDIVSPGYFETIKMPIVEGRAFRDSDREGAPWVAIISETLARQVWPGQSAIGRTFMQRVSENEERAIQIVGVAQGREVSLHQQAAGAVHLRADGAAATAIRVLYPSRAGPPDRAARSERRWRRSNPTCRSDAAIV